MNQASSDAAFELRGACVHCLRFAFGAPVGYPHATAQIAENSPPPAMFRRLQAASPPPTREGAPWHEGLTLDGGPFRPDVSSYRLDEVRFGDGLASLDPPEPETVVLDQWFTVPRQRHVMAFPGEDHGRFLVSIDYWNAVPESVEEIEKEVQYYDTYRMDWDRRPEGDWVAVSFDAFWPPERDSADLLIPLGECDDECPPTK
jgi:hypothetical protein